jgi:hypothetical protein
MNDTKTLFVGGLVAMGFDASGQYLLTVTHSGRNGAALRRGGDDWPPFVPPPDGVSTNAFASISPVGRYSVRRWAGLNAVPFGSEGPLSHSEDGRLSQYANEPGEMFRAFRLTIMVGG